MAILTPEIASLYGALDSAAFTKGASLNAYMLRSMAMRRNRLVSKGQHLCCLVWPTSDTTEIAGDVFSGFGPLRYTRIHPPIPILVKPGITSANVRMTMRTSSSDVVHVQIVSRGRPLLTSRIDAQVSSTTFTDVDIDDVPLHPDRNGFEELEIWVRGERTGTAGNETANGNFNAGTFETLHRDVGIDTGATWNNSGSGAANWGEGGHLVSIEDGSSNEVVSPREIVGVQLGTHLFFLPHLTPAEHAIALSYGPSVSFSIYQMAQWGIACFAAAGIARTA